MFESRQLRIEELLEREIAVMAIPPVEPSEQRAQHGGAVRVLLHLVPVLPVVRDLVDDRHDVETGAVKDLPLPTFTNSIALTKPCSSTCAM